MWRRCSASVGPFSRRLLSSSRDPPAERAWVRRTGTVLFSSLSLGTGALAGWQLHRYQWKTELIERRTAVLSSPPQPLRSVLAADAGTVPPELEYRRVHCSGTFDHSKQVLLGPRSAPAGMESAGGGRAPPGAPTASGWDVVTPLCCEDGSVLLVNRGWVPRDQVQAISKPMGSQRVEGILRCGEAGNRFAQNDPQHRRFVFLDVQALAELNGSSQVLIYQTRETGDATDSQWPVLRPTTSFLNFYVQPSTHLVYAATWSSLCALGGVLTYLRFLR